MGTSSTYESEQPFVVKNTIKPTALSQQVADFIAQVRPLDLIVFKGGDCVSDGIRKLELLETGSDAISHVEVAINGLWCSNIKLAPGVTNKTMLSWGSTLSGGINDGMPNEETGKTTFGVQIRVLEDLISQYIQNPLANVGVCRLIDNPTTKHKNESLLNFLSRTELTRTKISNAYVKYNGMTYNANPFALLGAMFPSMRPMRNAVGEVLGRFTSANKWLFCSEWVCVLYEELGIICDDTDGIHDGKMPDPRDVLPVDFLGYDADLSGIVVPICNIPPIWVKTLIRKKIVKKSKPMLLSEQS